LGPQFDVRAFHDEMLSGGVLPLDLLDARTNSWIKARKLAAKTTAPAQSSLPAQGASQ
jgi:hypothetical protein